MKIKELFNAFKESNVSISEAKERNLNKLGAERITTTIFKDEKRTPHYEQAKCIEIYNTKPLAASGINKRVDLIIGDKIEVKSSDTYTQSYYNKWLETRNAKEQIKKMILITETTGNSYIQPSWVHDKSGAMVMDNFKVIDDPSRVYYNLQQSSTEDDYWIYKIPYTLRATEADQLGAKYFKVTYVLNSYAFYEGIYGLPMSKNKFIHMKRGWNNLGYYGKSFLASAIDDFEIMEQILRNYATISRYMSLGKKIFQVGTDENPGDQADADQLKKFLDGFQDNENYVTQKKIDAQDLMPTKYDTLEGPLEFVRKTSTDGVIPMFATNWADGVTYASSNNAKIPFELSLSSIRKEYIEFLNEHLLSHIKKGNAKLSDDATFEFGNVSLDTKEEKMQISKQLYEDNAITLNQYLEAAGYQTLEGGDVFKYQRDTQIAKTFQGINSNITMNKDYLEDEYDNVDEEKKRVLTEALQMDKSDKRFIKNQKKKGVETKNFEVLRRNTLRGNEVRLISDVNKDKDKEYKLFLGPVIQNAFEDIEVAELAYKKLVDKVKRSFEEWTVEQDTPEYQTIKKAFDEMKKIQSKAIEEVINEIGKNKYQENFKEGILKEKELNSKVLGTIDDVFKRWNNKINNVINKTIDRIFGSSVGSDEDGLTTTTKVHADLSKDKTLLKRNIYNQFKDFNNQQSQDIKRDLTDAIITGKQTPEIQKDLKDKYFTPITKPNDKVDYKIKRILNTEFNKLNNLLKLKKWNDMGFDEYRWKTIGDSNVRPSHMELNNHVFKIEDGLNGKAPIPSMPYKGNSSFGINCRCRVQLVG